MNVEEEIRFIKGKLIEFENLIRGKSDRVQLQSTANYLNSRITVLEETVGRHETDIALLKE